MAGRSRKGQPLFVVIAGGALVLLRQLGLVFGDSHQKPSNFASFPVHIINLKRDTERWRRVSAEFAEKNVPSQLVHRLDAVSGKDLSKEELASKSTRCARLFCTRGTIGCYLSHKAFWDIVAAADEHDDDDDDEHEVDYRMVCEDDVVLADDDFYRRVQSLVREMETNGDPEWDVLLLGGLGCVHPDASRHGPYYRFAAWVTGGVRRPRRVTEHWHVPRRPFGAHAYLLSRRGAASSRDGPVGPPTTWTASRGVCPSATCGSTAATRCWSFRTPPLRRRWAASRRAWRRGYRSA